MPKNPRKEKAERANAARWGKSKEPAQASTDLTWRPDPSSDEEDIHEGTTTNIGEVGQKSKKQRHLWDQRLYTERVVGLSNERRGKAIESYIIRTPSARQVSICLYTLAGPRETIPLGLSQDLSDVPASMCHRTELPVAPVFKQRRWARISWQYKDEYRDGADACDAAKAVKSKRHHDTGDPRMRKREAEMAAKVDFLLSG